MADSIPSMDVCRKCKQEKPVDQFISKTKLSLACGRPTTDCLDCRNRRALVFREGLPLIDLQLGTPITTSTRTDAPITPRPGPSAASQEGVQLGTPIESPVSSLSIYPRPTRGGKIPVRPHSCRSRPSNAQNIDVLNFLTRTGRVICRIARCLIKIRTSWRRSGRSWKTTGWNTAPVVRRHGLTWA
ncbi:hypothetical protein FPOA_27751 [Fusarium poae]|uniref:Stc1 domain-containing protein n=1 Tax=Fusarium poae TaxID=36050 RepID=A0A1B8A6J0_FUSPO|nr:hypothetical protein FPOA_27751 [Fusarium poae]